MSNWFTDSLSVSRFTFKRTEILYVKRNCSIFPPPVQPSIISPAKYKLFKHTWITRLDQFPPIIDQVVFPQYRDNFSKTRKKERPRIIIRQTEWSVKRFFEYSNFVTLLFSKSSRKGTRFIYLFIFFEYHFQSKYLSRKQADEEKGTEEHDQTYFVRQ